MRCVLKKLQVVLRIKNYGQWHVKRFCLKETSSYKSDSLFPFSIHKKKIEFTCIKFIFPSQLVVKQYIQAINTSNLLLNY